jgi:enamine deaminase RidA (YjgF/YER057c/UK114 family)
MHCILSRHSPRLTPATMMVFLSRAGDEPECRELIAQRFGAESPVTTYVVQPPCCGAALAVEMWAVGGEGVEVTRYGSHLLTVESGGVRWIYCGGIRGAAWAEGPCAEALSAFQKMERQLARAGAGFDQVVRTWLYVNQITAGPEGRQRYQEVNRARTDFFRDRRLCGRNRAPAAPAVVYPASTAIGTDDLAITMSCMALDSARPDVFVLPLENPQQTPAWQYDALHSPHSPKFSRAMAVAQGHYVTTLVSGTASILNQQTCHRDDAARQTEQTIENIRRLIAPENFARHGLPGAGATLRDIARLRVSVKRPDDYPVCRNVVERLLPRVPVLYLAADMCRRDLLVEIEAVAFSPFDGAAPRRRALHGKDGDALS